MVENTRNEREADAPGRQQVFVSYARRDADAVGPLVAELETAGLSVWMDTSAIAPTADWMKEIHDAIDESTAVIALLSPAFVASTVCSEELEYAQAAGKKLVPVVLGQFDAASAPRWLSALNWILAYDATSRTDAVAKVVLAANSDLAWSEEHSRILVRAREWDLAGRPRSALLRGLDISRAETALVQDRPVNQPQATSLQREYVAASRGSRGRLVKLIVAIALAVALVSAGLAAVAVQQRSAALDALAVSDFRRLTSESEGAVTQSDSIRLALEATGVSRRAGRSDAERVAPLIASLARPDLPVVRLSGRVESQGARGERQGVDVSRDGSSLAHVVPDGRTRIVDLWTMRERLVVPAPVAGSGGTTFGHQVALNANGTRMAQVHVSEYGDGAPFSGRIQTFDVGGEEPVLLDDVAVDLMSPAAGLSFAASDTRFVVAEEEGTATVVTIADGEARVSHLGKPEERSNASLVNFGFSIDGTRSCSIGARLQMFDIAQQEQVIDLPANGVSGSCVPEACGGTTSNVLAEVEADFPGRSVLTCFARDGSTRGSADNDLQGTTLVPLLGLDSLEAPYDSLDQWETRPQAADGIELRYSRIAAPGALARALDRSSAVPGMSGPQLISVSDAGDIDVWTIGNGILDPIRDVESPSDVERLVPDSSLAPGALYSLDVADESGHASVVDAVTGEASEAFSEPVVSAGLDQVERLLDNSELLVISPTGRAIVYDSSGITSSYDVANEEEYESRLTAVSDEALVVASGGNVHVLDPSSGEEIAELASGSPDPYCAAGVSPDGSRAGVVTCGTNSAPVLSVWSDSASASSRREFELPFPSPTTVSLSDDGSLVAVASGGGEIALLQNGRFIQPPSLEVSAPEHNDFQSGWASVSPDGQWLLTRRDGRGLDLWLVSTGDAKRLATLSSEARYDPPVAVVFGDRGVTVGWNPGSSGSTARVVEWPIELSELRAQACLKISPMTSVDLSEVSEAEKCGDLRARRERPEPPAMEPGPPTTEGDEASPAVSIAAEFTQLAEGSFPRAIVVAMDGTVWVAASSADAIVRIGRDGVLSQFPLNESETSVGKLIEGPDRRIWFEGFQVIGSVGPDGDIDLRYVGIDPDGFATDGEASYSMSSGVDPQLFRTLGSSVQQTELPASLDGIDVSSLAITGVGDVWVAANIGGGSGSRYSLFNLPTTNVANEVQIGSGAPAGVIAASTVDQSVWFTVNRTDEATARIGNVEAGSEPRYYEVPDTTFLRDIAVDDSGIVWFTTDTGVGRVDGTGEVRSWLVPGAGGLSALSFAPDGALWVADADRDGVHRITFGAG